MLVHALIALAIVLTLGSIWKYQDKTNPPLSPLAGFALFILTYCFAEYVVDMGLRGMGWL
jgi:hypothetical protein